MSLGFELQESREDSFPRVSGDEPTERGDEVYTLMFSPRERG